FAVQGPERRAKILVTGDGDLDTQTGGEDEYIQPSSAQAAMGSFEGVGDERQLGRRCAGTPGKANVQVVSLSSMCQVGDRPTYDPTPSTASRNRSDTLSAGHLLFLPAGLCWNDATTRGRACAVLSSRKLSPSVRQGCLRDL